MRSGLKLISGVLAGLLLFSCSQSGEEPRPEEESPKDNIPAVSRMDCLYYVEEQFLSAADSPQTYPNTSIPYGGVVPHHLLPSDMIAGFFSLASGYKDSYDAVILLAPSHFPENCGSDVVTSTWGWETPFGSLDNYTAFTDTLLQRGNIGAENNPAAVEADHGAAGLIPFLRYYLGDIDVGVCLLANTLSRTRLQAFQEFLQEFCGDRNILLVASVDFSHYLTPQEAMARDEETRNAVENFRYDQILGYSDSNMDSPQVLTSFLALTESKGLILQELDRSDSSQKLPHGGGNPIFDEGVTSYFIFGAFEE